MYIVHLCIGCQLPFPLVTCIQSVKNNPIENNRMKIKKIHASTDVHLHQPQQIVTDLIGCLLKDS